jgi:hypothetical protein
MSGILIISQLVAQAQKRVTLISKVVRGCGLGLWVDAVGRF